MTDRLSLLSREAVEHLSAFKREVEEALPGRVARVTLFGSRARGEANPESDYDVAVFVQDSANDLALRHKVSDVAYPHILEGIYISPVVLPSHYAEQVDQTELAWEIARDGIVL